MAVVHDVPAHVLFDSGFLSLHDLIAVRSTCSSLRRDTSYVWRMAIQHITGCHVSNDDAAWGRCALFVLRTKCPLDKKHVIQRVFHAYQHGMDDDRQVARHVLDDLVGAERFKTLDPYWTLMYYMHYTHEGVCTVQPLVDAMIEGRLCDAGARDPRARLVNMLDLFRFAISFNVSVEQRAHIHPVWTWPIYRAIQSVLACNEGKQFFKVALTRHNGLLKTNIEIKIRKALQSHYAEATLSYKELLQNIIVSFASLVE